MEDNIFQAILVLFFVVGPLLRRVVKALLRLNRRVPNRPIRKRPTPKSGSPSALPGTPDRVRVPSSVPAASVSNSHKGEFAPQRDVDLLLRRARYLIRRCEVNHFNTAQLLFRRLLDPLLAFSGRDDVSVPVETSRRWAQVIGELEQLTASRVQTGGELYNAADQLVDALTSPLKKHCQRVGVSANQGLPLVHHNRDVAIGLPVSPGLLARPDHWSILAHEAALRFFLANPQLERQFRADLGLPAQRDVASLLTQKGGITPLHLIGLHFPTLLADGVASLQTGAAYVETLLDGPSQTVQSEEAAFPLGGRLLVCVRVLMVAGLISTEAAEDLLAKKEAVIDKRMMIDQSVSVTMNPAQMARYLWSLGESLVNTTTKALGGFCLLEVADLSLASNVALNPAAVAKQWQGGSFESFGSPVEMTVAAWHAGARHQVDVDRIGVKLVALLGENTQQLSKRTATGVLTGASVATRLHTSAGVVDAIKLQAALRPFGSGFNFGSAR